MTNQLSYSDWPLDCKKNLNNRAKTIKNNMQKIDKNKFKKMLNKNTDLDSDTDSESDIADFNPPPKPEITNDVGAPNNEIPEYSNELNYKKEINRQYSNNVSHPFTQYNNNDDEILYKKINYMINLLEEQKDEKTKNITEELILYCFLGIFIIFLIDSFVKIGKSKYTR
tara:strand:- start:342 stop:848 length:507 start_codon:yes stop_codon:yes gene_type:complete